ncbi:hypothetical protein [Streptomyces lydicus]|uniref:hypothetical protein n=1 Tax=Streptomyces lydicus TaxID=47763 RepID=UPI0037A39538
MPRGITARDVPEARQDVADWWGSPQCMRILSQPLTAQAKGVEDVARTARHIGLRKASVGFAELYFVNADMTHLAQQVAAGLEEWFLTEDVPEENHGFVVWEKPLALPDVPHELWPVAAAWGRAGDQVQVDTYGLADGLRCGERVEALRRKGFGSQFDLMVAGKLAYQASHTLRTGDKPDGLAALLLATWLLIRQPVEERKAVHETVEVPASRGSQKRIARGGGDPTRTVRYVTLRQSLRPSQGAEGGERHASRVYRHRWFVKPHRARQYYPSKGEHQTIWRGPYLVVPAGCEEAPILGGDRVNVLRR